VTTAEIKRTADPDAARRTLDLRMDEERDRMEEGRHEQQTTP
jgi:hypothetical protein